METHLDGYGIVPLHGSGTTNTKNWQLGDKGLCIYFLYYMIMINYVTYGFCGVRYFKKDRHERNNRSSSIFAGIALILNLAFLHTIEVCKSHETHGGASSCPFVPYLSCSWQRHGSEGVCW